MVLTRSFAPYRFKFRSVPDWPSAVQARVAQLVRAWVDPKQRDNKINTQIGHEVSVRLTATRRAGRNGWVAHLHSPGCVTVNRFVRRGPISVLGILVWRSAARSTKQGVVVSRCILRSKRDRFNPGRLSD